MKLLFTFLIILSSNFVKSQNFDKFEDYIVNEWILENYEINGTKFPPKSGHENDKMIFTKEYKSESINNGISQKGTWKFDKSKGILLVVDEKNRFNMELKVISYSENNCILELENPENQKIKIFLKANK
ncbi:hypothetical protein [Flavobacterium sasangense]|uniref:hypothetical protein n=1 Tax=Flavobacterium sasangense TaxID=503361 RepID=UPI00047B9F38|nr:hypothetical protein [Flavobacterium sasangense]